jgi:hypothetical protein
MSRVSWRRPSPALVISVLALFVALGGSAYAASKIGTNDIKANAITAGKIKKNAITTAKIKKDAVTGAKIKESSLGPVPSATNATNAINATNATNFSRYSTTGVIKAAGGQKVALFSTGPFTFVGHCVDLGGGEFEAFATVSTSQLGSSMSATEESYTEANFNPGTEAEIGYSINRTTPETNDTYGGYYTGFAVASADGKTLVSGNIASAVNYFGSSCAFWGHSENDS